MANTVAASGAKSQNIMILRNLNVKVDAASLICAVPMLVVYTSMNFLKTSEALGLYSILCVAALAGSWLLGFLFRAIALRPYSATLTPGKAKAQSQEAARKALLNLPAREACSSAARWSLAGVALAFAPAAFRLVPGSGYTAFTLVFCCATGILSMPSTFLSVELDCARILNRPEFRSTEMPHIRFTLRLRLGLTVSILVDYMAAIFIMNMAFAQQGRIELSQSMAGMLLLVVGTMLMVFYTMHCFASSVSKTVIGMNNTLEAMNRDSGDLTVRLDIIARDDIGLLSANFNRFLAFLNESMRKLQMVGRESRSMGSNLAATSEETSASTNQIAVSMDALKDRTMHLISELGDQQASISQATSSLETFLEKIEGQAAAVNQSSAAITEMIASLDMIESTTREKQKLVERLKSDGTDGNVSVEAFTALIDDIAKSTEFIMSLIDVIDNVAEQTNILSMNAAIEAAHAGEAGKGFSVVADEIRQLAESTGQNSKDIADSLKLIVGKIEQSSALTARTRTSFGRILSGIDAVNLTMRETLSALDEVSVGGKQIIDAVADLNNLTGEIRNASADMSGQMKVIQTSSEHVMSLGGESERSVAEMVQGIGEISKATAALSDLGSHNSQNIDKLDAEAFRFKTEASASSHA